VSQTLGKAPIALGKRFAECGTWQTPHDDSYDGEEGFAKYLFSGTRQNLCRVPKCSWQNKVRGLAKLPVTGTLPSARWKGTRQSSLLCRVPLSWHSSKMGILLSA